MPGIADIVYAVCKSVTACRAIVAWLSSDHSARQARQHAV